MAHGVRLAPILVGSCLYEHARELTRVQWLHDPGREGALNLAEQVGERDRRITQACTTMVGLLPQPAAQVTAGTKPGRGDTVMVEQVPVSAQPGALHGVPEPPAGYVTRDELTALTAAIADVDSGARGRDRAGGVVRVARPGRYR